MLGKLNRGFESHPLRHRNNKVLRLAKGACSGSRLRAQTLANRLARVAYKMGDKVTAEQAFASVEHMERGVCSRPHPFCERR